MASKTIPAKTVYICDCCGEESDYTQQVVMNVTELGEIGAHPIPIWRITKDLCWDCYLKYAESTARTLNALPDPVD